MVLVRRNSHDTNFDSVNAPFPRAVTGAISLQNGQNVKSEERSTNVIENHIKSVPTAEMQRVFGPTKSLSEPFSLRP
jgi:hypothetical protein